MHYAAIHEDEEFEIEVIEVSPGKYEVVFVDGGDNTPIRVDARRVKNTTWSFIIDDHAYNIEFEQVPTAGETQELLLVRGENIPIEVLDLRNLRLRGAQVAGGALEGPVEIRSPMPGKIIAVLVEEGQQVGVGDGLVVVEAMKMENELKAPKDGVVRHLDLVEGASVEARTVLCVVE